MNNYKKQDRLLLDPKKHNGLLEVEIWRIVEDKLICWIRRSKNLSRDFNIYTVELSAKDTFENIGKLEVRKGFSSHISIDNY